MIPTLSGGQGEGPQPTDRMRKPKCLCHWSQGMQPGPGASPCAPLDLWAPCAPRVLPSPASTLLSSRETALNEHLVGMPGSGAPPSPRGSPAISGGPGHLAILMPTQPGSAPARGSPAGARCAGCPAGQQEAPPSLSANPRPARGEWGESHLHLEMEPDEAIESPPLVLPGLSRVLGFDHQNEVYEPGLLPARRPGMPTWGRHAGLSVLVIPVHINSQPLKFNKKNIPIIKAIYPAQSITGLGVFMPKHLISDHKSLLDPL